MRRKQVELEQACLVAGRDLIRGGWRSMHDSTKLWALRESYERLAAYEATAIENTVGAYGHNSPDTSVIAAVMATPLTGSVRRRIVDEVRVAMLGVVDKTGCTDEELERLLGRKHTTVSSARNWLCNNGWLQDSGFTRLTTSLRPAIVWELTPAGVRAAWDR